jgi:hypothetical protein
MRDTPNTENHNFNEVKNLKIMGVQEMDAMEMRMVESPLLKSLECLTV